MRQFGFHQHIPISVPSGMDRLHRIDLRRGEDNWATYHDQYIQYWNARQTLRINGTPMGAFAQGYHDEYMQWYRRITRLWVSQSGGMLGSVVNGIEHINLRTSGQTELGRDDTAFIRDTSTHMLQALREDRRDTLRHVPRRAPPLPEHLQNPVVQNEEPRRRTGRRAAERARVEPDPNVRLPPPWEHPFQNVDPSHTFTPPPRSNVHPTNSSMFDASVPMHGFHGGPPTQQPYVGTSSRSGYQTHSYGGTTTESQHPPTGFQNYANMGSGFGASLFNQPPAYSSFGGSYGLGENMYTPSPLHTTPHTGTTQSGVETQHVDDTQDDVEEEPSTIHKRLRKKKHPRKRGCCPTD
ncbi:Serine/threonine-protein phosphatase 7 long form homolog [Linum perenne]